MKYTLSLFLLLFIGISSKAQETWTDGIATIFHEHCAGCHHSPGFTPFDLVTYEDVLFQQIGVRAAVESKYMPPWPADPDYRRFAHEIFLTDDQVDAIVNWIDNGAPVGDWDDIPETPVFSDGGSTLETVDLSLEIGPYTIPSNAEEYRWFVVPTDFEDTVYVNKIEVIAGSSSVHHADLSYDLSGISAANDAADPLPGFNELTGAPNYSFYMNAWQPGGNIAEYPDGWGIAVPPGADFVMELHFGPNAMGTVDNTTMNLQFADAEDEDFRNITVGWLLGHGNMTDGPLVIPADEEVAFHQELTLTEDMSLVGICPHMHLLGKSYRVWAITPDDEEIPLIDIPQWDFEWQRYYYYPEIQILPAGTTIYSEGWYDNTDNNHHNPNDPPITVSAGSLTTDEMFLCYFMFADYQDGDEFIIVDDELTSVSALFSEPLVEVNVSPNPSSERIQLCGELPNGNYDFSLVDETGKTQHSWSVNVLNETLDQELFIGHLASGKYWVRYTKERQKGSTAFIKIK